MVEPRPEIRDPLNCCEELRAALHQPELDEVRPPGTSSPAAQQAACRLAVALGRCRLFGVEAGEELDGTLTGEIALAAAVSLEEHLVEDIAEARSLGQRWDAAIEPFEADDLCVGLLDARMDAWAACVALDEALEDCLAEGDARVSALTVALDRLQPLLDQLDDQLLEQEDMLSVVAGTELLNNWRALLAEPYRDVLPWWLEGRLEEAARRLQRQTQADLRTFWPRPRAYPPSILPQRVPPSLAAAATEVGPPQALPGPTLAWLSPDGRWRAELKLPKESDALEEGRLRPINFTRSADDIAATELNGRPVRLGRAGMTIDDTRALVSLADLREAVLELSVGDPMEVWLPEGWDAAAEEGTEREGTS